MKTTVVIILIFLGLLGLMWLGSSNKKLTESSDRTKSVLSTSEEVYDFGTISMKNGDVTKEFIITNSTDKDIFVPSLTTSCMCTRAYLVQLDGKIKGPFGMPSMSYVPRVNEIIKVGESRVVRVVYDPNAHGPAGVGRINRFVTLTDALGGELRLEIRAVVTP
ncbi:MAG: hypothetical protein LiPW41_652 [Parcubacteria group bacterium LiPW_41]|nr:MAG: hypothetical protein LiPW41_652 [Parcubacteria group bacterium LiPW_41]